MTLPRRVEDLSGARFDSPEMASCLYAPPSRSELSRIGTPTSAPPAQMSLFG